jgi:hypothetical protein
MHQNIRKEQYGFLNYYDLQKAQIVLDFFNSSLGNNTCSIDWVADNLKRQQANISFEEIRRSLQILCAFDFLDEPQSRMYKVSVKGQLKKDFLKYYRKNKKKEANGFWTRFYNNKSTEIWIGIISILITLFAIYIAHKDALK